MLQYLYFHKQTQEKYSNAIEGMSTDTPSIAFE